MRAYSCPICGSANCSIFGVRKPSRLASSPYEESLSETAKERPGGARERREGRAHHARPGGVRARAGIRPDDGGAAANGPAAPRERGDRVSGEPRRCGGLCDPGHDRGRAARNPGDAPPRDRPLQPPAGLPGSVRDRPDLDLGNPAGLVALRERSGQRPSHPSLHPGDPDRVRLGNRCDHDTQRGSGGGARAPVRDRHGSDDGRGGPAARPGGRLLDEAGPAQRAGQPRRDGHTRGHDPRAADAAPWRGKGRRRRG